MLSESEFNQKLKICMRHARKGIQTFKLADKMHMSPGVYFAYERSDLKLTAYQLYVFMHMTGKDAEYIKQLFDSNWLPPSMNKPRIPDDG